MFMFRRKINAYEKLRLVVNFEFICTAGIKINAVRDETRRLFNKRDMLQTLN